MISFTVRKAQISRDEMEAAEANCSEETRKLLKSLHTDFSASDDTQILHQMDQSLK